MTAETPRTEQQHWAEAVAECVTDEQDALRIVGFYEDGEWQPAMLAIGRENLALKRDLTAARARVAELEAIATMLDAVVQGAQEEFVRVPYGASHEDVAQINDWHKMAREARALLAASPDPQT